MRNRIAESADEGKAERDVEKFDISMGMYDREDFEEENLEAKRRLLAAGEISKV
jgi:hypothetical protein